MKECPRCGDEASRESVHNGVAMIYGPWGCHCGWSENEKYDLSKSGGLQENGRYVDQWGMGYPEESLVSIAIKNYKRTIEIDD